MNRPESISVPDVIPEEPVESVEPEIVAMDPEAEEAEEAGAVEEVEADAEDVVDHAIQVASMAAMSDMEINNDDEMLFVQLGDYVMVESQKYNGQTRGQVYYRSLEKIRIKPDGVSDTLHDFELDQTDEEERYQEADGVTAVYIIEKRKFESFVEQQDLRVQQVVDALGEDGSVTSYRVTQVNKDEDAITLQSMEDPESERTITFGFIGIPPEERIRILSIREFIGKEAPNDSSQEAQEAKEAQEPEDIEEEAEEFNEEQNRLNRIELLGTVEIVKPVVYRETASYEQRIPDHLQKMDALNDFINSLDPSLQKDPHALRQIRILVETLYQLNKETIEYGPEGDIVGPRTASLQTLSELVTRTHVPMGRPVLQVSKRLYTLPEDEDEKVESDEVFMKPFVAELLQMVENTNPLVASVMSGPTGSKTVIREWLQQQLNAKAYPPWTSDPSLVPLWSPHMDTEFFRSHPPAAEEESEGVHVLQDTVQGYIPSEPPILGTIPFGLTRALGPTFRKGTERRKQLLLPAEGATLDAYLLFPEHAIPSIGRTRSYDLATDSGRSHLPLKTMRTLLEELGEPVDKRSTSKNILLLRSVGGELGTIPLHSYIAGLHLPLLGWADAFPTLIHYGLDDYELYPSLYRTLKNKMALGQAQVLSALARLRQELPQPGAAPESEAKTNELIPSATLWETLASQEILVRSLEEYQRRNPTLARSDIGKTLHLLRYHDNFFQVTAGKNPLLIAKAVMAAYNQEYIDALRIQSLIRQREREAGTPPKKNKCAHVADMVSVRRLQDDTERFYELTKVFRRYQGERKENWFHCNICKEHLLCIHERLQLQAYLHPREKDIIDKEIILECSGGQFQGKYICRNCGQPIRDLDFDNRMEFDDDGRPLAGQGALEDEDVLLEDRIEDLIKTKVETEEPTRWKMTMEEKKCYDVVRILSERVGIFLDQEGFKSIIQRTFHHLGKLPPRSVYSKLKGVKMDYDVYHSRHFIAFCSLFLLIEIQSKKPDYVVRYRLQGCKSTGFDGYPLNTDPSKRDGMEYLACAVSSIRLATSPWKDTGYFSEPNDVKRLEAVLYYMTTLLPKVLQDPTIQASLADKRRYLTEVLGRVSASEDQIPRDMVFPTFLPALEMPTQEEAVENAITPEIAEKMGEKGQQALIQLWIRRAHQFASESAAMVRGSPYLETTCCLSPLTAPQQAWSTVDQMPPLARRIWSPHVQGPALVTHFQPRSQDLAVAEADKELFYRIFLKYCFQGPRIGHAHELNLTHRCVWCGFQFPTHPALMDAEKEGKPALSSQEVKTDTEAFTQLLDRIHTVHEVVPTPLPHRTSFTEVMAEFGSMEPAPVESWSTLMGQTMDAFLKIQSNGMNQEEMKGEIVVALGPLSDVARQHEAELRQRIPAKHMAVMEEIVSLPWNAFFQVLQTYFVTLFYRALSGFSKTSIFLPVELRKELSDQHVEDLRRVLAVHLETSSRVASDSVNQPKMDLAKAKLQYVGEQMAEILRFRDKIRALTLPGRKITLEYFQRVLFYGPLATLVNSYHIPAQAPIQSAVQEIGNPSIQYLLLLIHASLEKYSRERLSYDEEKIKNMMAVQAEKERVKVLKDFDQMTDEERAVEKMNKKLGLGKWAVGGSKVIYMYNKGQYDVESEFRKKAGMVDFIDFPDMSGGDEGPPQGQAHDALGFPLHSDAEYEREGAYDVAQHGDED